MQTIQLPTTPVDFRLWAKAHNDERIKSFAKQASDGISGTLTLTKLSAFIKDHGLEWNGDVVRLLDHDDFFSVFDSMV